MTKEEAIFALNEKINEIKHILVMYTFEKLTTAEILAVQEVSLAVEDASSMIDRLADASEK